MEESRKIVQGLKILSGIESQNAVLYNEKADHSAHSLAYLSRQLIQIA
jgi:hypothetical protein